MVTAFGSFLNSSKTKMMLTNKNELKLIICKHRNEFSFRKVSVLFLVL